MPAFYNCHIHTFTARAAPSGFLPFRLTPLARSRFTGPFIGALLKGLVPWSKTDRLERMAAFATIGRMKSQRAIFDEVRGYYSKDFRFVVLSLDMDWMEAGRAPQPYVEQLAELAELKRHYDADREAIPGLVLPFVCVDPRRPQVLDLVRECIEEAGFAGIKLYPPLGFWPFDRGLWPVYAYAEEHEVPILSHCSRGGAFFKGKITAGMRKHPLTGLPIRGGKKAYTDAYSDPDNYLPVLQDFPNLRLCLAHYGGGEEWDAYLKNPVPVSSQESWIRKISTLLSRPEWPNVYADVSSTAAHERNLPLIQVLAHDVQLRTRVVFGSDFFMIQRDTTERRFGIGLRAAVGEEAWWRMASENPERWLFGSRRAVPPASRVDAGAVAAEG